jgi:hypothetical protein
MNLRGRRMRLSVKAPFFFSARARNLLRYTYRLAEGAIGHP